MSHCFLDFAKFLVKIFVFSKLALGGGKLNVSNVLLSYFNLKKRTVRFPVQARDSDQSARDPVILWSHGHMRVL